MNSKNTLLTCLLLLFVTHLAHSQPVFPDETAQQKWEYVTWNFWGGLCEKRMVMTGPTIALCGKNYIEVLDCDENEQHCLKIGYYRVQKDSVLVRTRRYLWDDPNFTEIVDCNEPEGLMFDFGVAAGDTLACQVSGSHPPLFTDFWKTKEENISYEGVERSTLTMNFRPYPAYPNIVYPMKWIRGIGSNVHPFYSFTCIGDHCEWEQQVTKVFTNGALIYQDTALQFSYPCTGWKMPPVDTVATNQPLLLFPNPAKEYFYIQSGLLQEATFDWWIYDQLGRLVGSQTGHPNREKIPVNNLSPGIYYVRMEHPALQKWFKFCKI